MSIFPLKMSEILSCKKKKRESGMKSENVYVYCVLLRKKLAKKNEFKLRKL